MLKLLNKFVSDMDLGYPIDMEEARHQVAQINSIHNQLVNTKDQVISTAGKTIFHFTFSLLAATRWPQEKTEPIIESRGVTL